MTTTERMRPQPWISRDTLLMFAAWRHRSLARQDLPLPAWIVGMPKPMEDACRAGPRMMFGRTWRLASRRFPSLRRHPRSSCRGECLCLFRLVAESSMLTKNRHLFVFLIWCHVVLFASSLLEFISENRTPPRNCLDSNSLLQSPEWPICHVDPCHRTPQT